MPSFAERLTEYRTSHGLNQARMGEMLGVSGPYIGMLERGEKDVAEDSTISKLLSLYEQQSAQPGAVIAEEEASFGGNARQLLKAARLKKGLSFKELAKISRVNADVIQAIEEGSGGAQEWMIDKLSRSLNIEKEKLTAGSDHVISKDPIHGTYGAKPDIITPPGVWAKMVPVISMAQAGHMGSYDDAFYTHEATVAFSPEDPKAIALRITGDSMYPKIEEGDMVILYPTRKPRSGRVVVGRLNEESGGDVMCKIYTEKDDGNRVVMSSYNEERFPPREYRRDQFVWIYPAAQILKPLM